MRESSFQRLLRVEFAPPRYLSLLPAGIDVSASGIKIAILSEKEHGLELSAYDEERLQAGAVVGGEIVDRGVVIQALHRLAKKHRIRVANVALSESRSYLFEADVAGSSKAEWRTATEQHIDEYIPVPPAEAAFDILPTLPQGDLMHVIGVGSARRAIEESLSAFEEAEISVRAVESEIFSMPRSVLPHGDTETVLLIDIGRTTSKLVIVGRRIPRFATTLEIGGHSLTLAVQKYFGVTEEEAKRVKVERGLVPESEHDEYVAAMLSTVSALKDEIVRRFDYWQTRASAMSVHEPITRAVLVGGNATVRGLPEYLESALRIPVELGDVFTNLASRDVWLPPLPYNESLAYTTAIGLALREYVP